MELQRRSMNPMAKWGDKGKYEGRDEDNWPDRRYDKPMKFVIKESRGTSVTSKEKE